MAPAGGFHARTYTSSSERRVSHDTTNAGIDSFAALPRDGEAVVKWPVLAQLPWVGETDDAGVPFAAGPPVDILPFASEPAPYVPPTLDESSIAAAPLRLVDPTLPADEDYAAAPPTADRRLHRPAAAERPQAEPPHVNLHRFPATTVDMAAVHEAERPAAAAAPRQYRRVDPAQPRFHEGLSVHHPEETFATQLYQWQATHRSQMALLAVSLLLLTGGVIYFAALGRGTTEPKVVAEPPAWEIKPIPPVSGGPNETLAAPLPTTPSLDLSTAAPTDATVAPPASEPPAPITNQSPAEADDPIARYLNQQPALPERTASKDAAEFATPAAKPVETIVEKPVMPTAEPAAAPQPTAHSVTQSASQPAPDATITPTPSLTLTAPYPTTPYPPFPASLAPPAANLFAAPVAEALGPTFGPPQPPR